MSLRELWNVRRAYRDRRRDGYELAWMGEALARQKRLPDLAKLLGKSKARKQTWQEMKAYLKAIS